MWKHLMRSLTTSVLALTSLSTTLVAQDNKPWLIGQVVSLSGPAAAVGAVPDKVAKMWVEEVNATGGIRGRKVEMITCNEESKVEKAIACAREMIDKGVILIIGNTLTASLRGMQPLMRRGPILLTGAPQLMPAADSYTFQTSPSDEQMTKFIAGFVKANGFNTIGVVAGTDASGEIGAASALKVFGPSGIEMKLERIDLRATDATAQLASIGGAGIPLVYATISGAGGVTVVKSYKNLGLQQPLIVSIANINRAFPGLVKDVKPPRLLGVGLVAAIPAAMKSPGSRKLATAFYANYLKRYNEPADNGVNGAIGRATVDVADAILRHVSDPTDFKSVKKYLESNVVEGVMDMHFSPTTHIGAGEGLIMMVELKDGEWVPAEPLN